MSKIRIFIIIVLFAFSSLVILAVADQKGTLKSGQKYEIRKNVLYLWQWGRLVIAKPNYYILKNGSRLKIGRSGNILQNPGLKLKKLVRRKKPSGKTNDPKPYKPYDPAPFEIIVDNVKVYPNYSFTIKARFNPSGNSTNTNVEGRVIYFDIDGKSYGSRITNSIGEASLKVSYPDFTVGTYKLGAGILVQPAINKFKKGYGTLRILGYYGACAVKADYVSFGHYRRRGSHRFFEIKRMGKVNSKDELKSKCTESIFSQLLSDFCKNNSSIDPYKLHKRYALLYKEEDGSFMLGSPFPTHKICRPTIGYCIVIKKGIPIPPHDAPNKGEYYMKQSSGIGAVHPLFLKNRCKDSIFSSLTNELSLEYPNQVLWEWMCVIYDKAIPDKIVYSLTVFPH
ncbi:MAG: hypothetical protein ABFR75_14165 [Acidobacteriota bacterium]